MRLILLPFGLIYGLVVTIRNFFYNKGWLRSFEFDFPIILVGNLSAGGTGKTPHVAYLIKNLQEEYTVATLSRGYRRTLKGYGLATDLSLVEDIGDEPKLYKQRYPKTEVAVSENRVEGVYYLLNDEPDVKVVVMDDGFQHRRIRAGLNIILTTWQKPFFNDYMLPAGNLREPKYNVNRADIIIVSKCPATVNADDRLRYKSKMGLTKNQQVYFTTLVYGGMYPLFIKQPKVITRPSDEVILMTGIAGNRQLKAHVETLYSRVHVASFADHHYFMPKDFERLKSAFPGVKTIITTEKDAMRLMEQEEYLLNTDLSIFVLPVEVSFIAEEETFLNQVQQYIKKYPERSAQVTAH